MIPSSTNILGISIVYFYWQYLIMARKINLFNKESIFKKVFAICRTDLLFHFMPESHEVALSAFVNTHLGYPFRKLYKRYRRHIRRR